MFQKSAKRTPHSFLSQNHVQTTIIVLLSLLVPKYFRPKFDPRNALSRKGQSLYFLQQQSPERLSTIDLERQLSQRLSTNPLCG